MPRWKLSLAIGNHQIFPFFNSSSSLWPSFESLGFHGGSARGVRGRRRRTDRGGGGGRVAVGARPVEAALKGARMSGWSTHALGDSGGAMAARGRVGGPGPPNAPPRRSLVMVVFLGHEIGSHFSLKICCRSEVKNERKAFIMFTSSIRNNWKHYIEFKQEIMNQENLAGIQNHQICRKDTSRR